MNHPAQPRFQECTHLSRTHSQEWSIPGQMKILITRSYAVLPVTQALTEACAVQQPAHLIFSTTLRGKKTVIISFIHEKAVAQRGLIACTRSHGQHGAELSSVAAPASLGVQLYFTQTQTALYSGDAQFFSSWHYCTFSSTGENAYQLQVAMNFNVVLICSSFIVTDPESVHTCSVAASNFSGTCLPQLFCMFPQGLQSLSY